MVKVKIKEMLYVISALVLVIVGPVLYLTFFVTHSNVANVGNNWNYISGASPLLTNAKVPVTFISIESCQFCAAERYALFYALSNLGNWTYYGRKVSLSTLPSGNYSSNPTTDNIFYKASEGDWTINFLNSHLSYSSVYVNFTSVEVDNNAGQPLQSTTPAQNTFLSKYDPKGDVPFTYIGNNFFETGAGSSLLSSEGVILFNFSGYSGVGIPNGFMPAYILAQLNISGSVINRGITTEAEYITAWICKDLGNIAPTCNNASISQLENKLS